MTWIAIIIRYETELFPDKPTAQPLDVAVVGAGPAGLAFATTAAKRGHRVTLYEASDKIGGQFNLAKMVPGKVCGVPLMVTTDVKRHQLLMISDDLGRPLIKSVMTPDDV